MAVDSRADYQMMACIFRIHVVVIIFKVMPAADIQSGDSNYQFYKYVICKCVEGFIYWI